MNLFKKPIFAMLAGVMIGIMLSGTVVQASSAGKIYHYKRIFQKAVTLARSLVVHGDTTLGDAPEDTIVLNGSISSDSGAVQIADNLNVTGALTLDTPIDFSELNISQSDITALGIPAEDTNTTYSAGTGLALVDTTFSSNLGTDISSSEIVDSTITDSDLSSTAGINLSKLTSGSAGQLVMGTTSTGVPTYTTMSGDATITGAGALTIANGAVTPAKLSATGSASATTFLRGDGTWATPTDNQTTFGGTTVVASTSVTTPDVVLGVTDVMKSIEVATNTNIYSTYPDSVILVVKNTSGSSITITRDGLNNTVTVTAGSTAIFLKTNTSTFSQVN